jgi:hypothetical protein
MHSIGALGLQGAPFCNFCAAHFPAMQYCAVGGQLVCSLDDEQLVKHAVPLHAKPPQAIGRGMTHLPPLQVEAAVSIPPLQLCAGHTVPHPPQFFASVSVSVHVPPQTVIAGGTHPLPQL